ncbi:MAG TPA: VTT domain-containing protein [Dehalococcoidia bacterium]|jgi:membrane protein DedA with SNARE-associated domain|nr:VTT domain-containing protein [Dehalococcoidia bacterium]
MAQSSVREGAGDDARPEAVSQARQRSRVDRAILRAGAWLALHPRLRALLIAAVVGVAVVLGIALLVRPDLTDGLEGAGYVGIFLINLISTSTVAIPIPAVTATAQLLIVRQAAHSDLPWLVGIVGGIGMGLGEVTAYYAGYLGAELVQGREMRGPRWLRAIVKAAIDAIAWLMRKWGMATIFMLAAIPNPLFEVAGLSAGSARLSVRGFLVASVAGKVVRGLLLAYLGTRLPFV